MDTTRNICCQLFRKGGEEYNDCFVVSVPSNAIIEDLRKAIIDYANLDMQGLDLAVRKSIDGRNELPLKKVEDLVQELERDGASDIIIMVVMLRDYEGTNCD